MAAAGASALTTALGRPAEAQSSRLGLSASGANVMLNGKPYYGMGVNFVDLFDHTFSPYDDYVARLTELAAYDVPFVRFNLGGFNAGAYPNESAGGWRYYFVDKANWYARADAIVSTAESLNIGLIPNLFWRWATVPDLMAYNPAGNGLRDALDQWGVASSFTRQFMRQITTEVVTRYAGSKAIWAWEIANEIQALWLLNPRQPPSASHTAPGGPAQYYAVVPPGAANGHTDIVSPPDVFSAINEWCALVRSLDPSQRLLSGGNAVSDVAAYNHATMTANVPDSYSQWMGLPPYNGFTGGLPFPVYDNDAALGTLSAHIYQDSRTPYWYFGPPSTVSMLPEGLFGIYMQLSEQYKRPFFLGEFGATVGLNNTPNKATEIEQFGACTAKLVQLKVPLSAVWNYGYLSQDVVRNDNINPAGPYGSGSKLYQLQAISGLNRQLNA